jgi:2-keto-4-pentenoate hydratase/2-oxohepta-3-ene-1,7-dioic acid hydratase in catechol pathway
MRLASFSRGGRAAFGVVQGDGIVDLSTAEVPTLRSALTTWGMEGLLERARGGRTVVPLQGATWLQPIVDPDKIVCVGLNYFEHAKEANLPVPDRPSLFVRFASSQVGHLESVERPRASQQFDYEAELAVVIGRGGRHITEAQATGHVLGYSCFAENSIRDWQMHSRQATPGKNFERSGAFGPWIVTPDEAGPVENMEVIGRLNGREMQHDKAGNMIFSIAQTIAYVSTFATLLPGDVIVTGTPAGVGFTRKPPVWLVPGDRFDVEITGVGVLSNGVVDETQTRSN